MFNYPYSSGNITTRQAVEFIAAVVYPGENEIAARKRVRERIRYAQKTGKVSRSNSLVAPEIFRWALNENPDWAPLAKVAGLPLTAIVATLAGNLGQGMTCKAYGVVIPVDPDRLREEFVHVETERQRLAEQVLELKRHIVELETEVADWREKDRQVRERNSQAGKLGGRGNAL